MTNSNLKPDPVQNENQQISLDNNLILHNDDFNTFEFVIDCLIDVCGHDELQAEQCAFLTHYKGKCQIKKGELRRLKPMKDSLADKGLSVTIE
ncbi:MAG TPA: ATP-dependent Clp protease adaptor ClpS [Bacteroidales bacterium]|nr:ATP-dependent Clp protease adaptor ClpS [Bacteroidales bacterium]